MNFSVEQSQFSKALLTVGKGISTRTTLPHLSGVLLDLEGNKLTLVGSNGDIGIKVFVEVEGSEDGSVLIPARLLSDFVSTLPSGNLTLSSKGEGVSIEGVKTRTSFSLLPLDEYPELVFESSQTVYTLPVREMANAIDRVSFASSTDEARAILTGISLKAEKGLMEIAATDGFRLSLEKFTLPQAEETFSVVVPSKTLQEVSRMVRESSVNNAGNFSFRLSQEGSQIIFTFADGTLFMSRLVEGTFPPYAKIIPSSYSTRVIFDSEELVRTIKTASLFARSGASVVKMNIVSSTGVIALFSATEQVGEYSGEMSGVVEGSDNSIAFNSKYMLEFLAKVKSEKIVLEMNGANQPGVWKVDSLPEYLHVVMPIRTE